MTLFYDKNIKESYDSIILICNLDAYPMLES